MSRPTGTPQPYRSIQKITAAFEQGAGVFQRDDVERLLNYIANLQDRVFALTGDQSAAFSDMVDADLLKDLEVYSAD